VVNEILGEQAGNQAFADAALALQNEMRGAGRVSRRGYGGVVQ
jgi:GGDEF domain-containing protein